MEEPVAEVEVKLRSGIGGRVPIQDCGLVRAVF